MTQSTQLPIPLSPLELPGWVEFTSWRSGLKPLTFETVGDGGAVFRATLYTDRRGRVKTPPNSPYLPVVFRSSRSTPGARTNDWHRVVAPLVAEMKRRGSANELSLPPEIVDVRPWRWSGFLAGVRYTYYLDLPFDPSLIRGSLRQRDRRAEQLGMRVERVVDTELVVECLAGTEERKQFSHDLGARDLKAALDIVGEDALRMYVCFDPEGSPASASVMLHAPGARAIAWVGGTKTARLTDEASWTVRRHAYEDLATAGATGLDLAGANIPSVAAFKAQLGAQLVPYYSVQTLSFRTAALLGYQWWRSR